MKRTKKTTVSTGPKRLRVNRDAGWKGRRRDAVYVGRCSEWANPYDYYATPEELTEKYRKSMEWRTNLHARIRAELAGRDLECHCRLDVPCHADVLLEIANDEWDVIRPGLVALKGARRTA